MDGYQLVEPAYERVWNVSGYKVTHQVRPAARLHAASMSIEGRHLSTSWRSFDDEIILEDKREEIKIGVLLVDGEWVVDERPSMPLYRVRNQQLGPLLVSPYPNGRGIIFPDVEGPLGAEAAWAKYFWYGFGLGDGTLHVADAAFYGGREGLESEPLHLSFRSYLDARDRVDPNGEIEDKTRNAFIRDRMRMLTQPVRYQEKVYVTQDSCGKTRKLTDPDTDEEQVVDVKALVYINENVRGQVFFEGEVCHYEPLYKSVMKRDGTTVKVQPDQIIRCADKPVGPRVLYRGRECHYKWATRPYAMIYDPKIKADRKVTLRSLKWIDPKPEVL